MRPNITRPRDWPWRARHHQQLELEIRPQRQGRDQHVSCPTRSQASHHSWPRVQTQLKIMEFTPQHAVSLALSTSAMLPIHIDLVSGVPPRLQQEMLMSEAKVA